MSHGLPPERMNPVHQPPKRARTKLLLGLAVAFAVLGIIGLVLFGPTPRVRVSPPTTHISTPLAADGLPDYAQALLEERRRGVTPENNGAVLFWQAMGPSSMSTEHFELLCRDLQIIPPPTPPYLVDVSGREMRDVLTRWIEEQHKQATSDPLEGAGEDAALRPEDALADTGEFFDAELIAEDSRDQAGEVPWTAADCPPLATWVDANSGPLDLLVAAAARPKFYSPPPNLLENPNATLIAILLPAIQDMRAAARSLNVRAAYRVGQGNYDQAWQDSYAVWRLGDRASDGFTLVERLVGFAIRGVARGPTLALLERDDLPEQIAQQVLDDLNDLTPRISIADATDRGERFVFLDATIRMLTGRFGDETGMGAYDEGLASLQHLSIDPNVPLIMGNEWYDRVVAAMRIEDRASRRTALDRIESDLAAFDNASPSKFLGGALSRKSRSAFVGERLMALFLPALGAAVDAEDRDAINLTLTRTAAALAVFRARNGAYPATLDELAPSILLSVPIDLYSNQPLIYSRRGAGYVLYSVFQNGVDDGGQDFSGEIVDGEWVGADDPDMLDSKQSDYVIRIPRRRWRPAAVGVPKNDRGISEAADASPADKAAAGSASPDGD